MVFLLFNDTQVAYVKSIPEFEFNLPEGVEDVLLAFTLYGFLTNRNGTVKQTQNWSKGTGKRAKALQAVY